MVCLHNFWSRLTSERLFFVGYWVFVPLRVKKATEPTTSRNERIFPLSWDSSFISRFWDHPTPLAKPLNLRCDLRQKFFYYFQFSQNPKATIRHIAQRWLLVVLEPPGAVLFTLRLIVRITRRNAAKDLISANFSYYLIIGTLSHHDRSCTDGKCYDFVTIVFAEYH